MDATNFDRITAEFTPEFKQLKGLAAKRREVLFPVRDGKLWTGTDMTEEGTSALYSNMINAFDMATTDASNLQVTLETGEKRDWLGSTAKGDRSERKKQNERRKVGLRLIRLSMLLENHL